MRIATFNIYWLGKEEKAPRAAHHLDLLAGVVRGLDADVVAFQEIVNVDVLRSVLDRVEAAGGRRMSIEDARGRTLSSGGIAQKVVVAYDPARLAVETGAALAGGPGRRPVAVRFCTLANLQRWLLVGVHLQSGYPHFADPADAETRQKQCTHLVEWLAGRHGQRNPALRSPEAQEPTIVLGDLNALKSSDQAAYEVVVRSLDPLRDLEGWRWEEPLEDPRGGGRYSSWVDRYLIDHILLSPELAESLTSRPTMVAFDLEPELRTKLVSDHRPVVADIDI